MYRVLLFQSTLPRGSDCVYTVLRVHSVLFQSTLPRGSDSNKCYSKYRRDISIHAPSRERLIFLVSKKGGTGFQSTLPRGSDTCDNGKSLTGTDFNPRSLAGATNVALAALIDSAISIHAPSRERLKQNRKSVIMSLFQSTLPRGSDQLKELSTV